MNVKTLVSGIAIAALATFPLQAGVVKMAKKPGSSVDLAPTGKGWGEARPDAPERWAKGGNGNGHGHNGGGGGSGGQYGIYYHGGPIMLGTTSVYYIYYGTWSASQAAIFEDFASSLGGSPYFNMETTYWDSNNNYVANSVRFGGATYDAYSQGTSLSDSAIFSIVQTAIQNGSLPKDANGVYFVITSPDVAKSGFCTSYCGWHTNGSFKGTDLKYSFVGDSDRCPSACSGQSGSSPNGDTGVDGAINIIAHELNEAVSDPDLNAWFDSFGRENADKCAWTWGTQYTAPNGSRANVHLGGRDYLLQENWVNAANVGCALAY